MIEVKKRLSFLFAVLTLFSLFSCRDTTSGPSPISDSCLPPLSETKEVDVVFDYYRIATENPEAQEVVSITGSVTDFYTKPAAKIGKDHFQYACKLKAYWRPQDHRYSVAFMDSKRYTGGTTYTFAEKILANGVELTKEEWGGSDPFKVFYLDLCRVYNGYPQNNK